DRAPRERETREARDVAQQLFERSPDAGLLRGAVEVVAELAQLPDLPRERALDLDVALTENLELVDLGILRGALGGDALFERANRDPLTAVADLATQDVAVDFGRHRAQRNRFSGRAAHRLARSTTARWLPIAPIAQRPLAPPWPLCRAGAPSTARRGPTPLGRTASETAALDARSAAHVSKGRERTVDGRVV